MALAFRLESNSQLFYIEWLYLKGDGDEAEVSSMAGNKKLRNKLESLQVDVDVYTQNVWMAKAVSQFSRS